MRVFEGRTKRLVDFGNLKIDGSVWKTQWIRMMWHRKLKRAPIGEKLWNRDPQCRDFRAVRQLQKKIQQYLGAIAANRSADSKTEELIDFLDDFEGYSEKEGFSYDVRVIRQSRTAPSDDLFSDHLLQTKIAELGPLRVRIDKIPKYNSLKQYFYTCLAGALEAGELGHIQKCFYKPCGQFFIAPKSNRKFCREECRWNYNNAREDRKEQRRKNRLLKNRSKASSK
jgi:hypothetical protein